MKVDLSKATPRPWRLEGTTIRPANESNPRTAPIARCDCSHGLGDARLMDEANAALIFAAVNTFDVARELAQMIFESALIGDIRTTLPKTSEWDNILIKAREVLKLMGADNDQT